MRILILFFVLGSACHAELRTWTAVNGKEVEAEFVSNEKGIVKLKLKSGKIFEVPANKLSKEDNEFIGSLAKPEKINPNPEGVNQDELEEREGIIYLKGSDTPFTGKYLNFFENGQKKLEGSYKDGKLDGLEVAWHENGKKMGESKFKDGMDVLRAEYYENGQKAHEITFKDGKMILEMRWYENGNKLGEGHYKDGQANDLWARWHENGKKASEAYHSKGGKLVEGSEKFWNNKGEPVDSMQETGWKPTPVP